MMQWDEDLAGRVAAIDILALILPREIRKTYVEELLIDSAIVASARLGYGVKVWRDAAGFHAHPARDVVPGFVHDASGYVRLA